MSKPSSLKLLVLAPELLPTHRADVATLFGKYLPRHGITCDLIGRSDGKPAPAPQGYASMHRVSGAGGRLRSELRFVGTCVRKVLGARRGEYAALQVRDMVTVGLLTMLAAKLRGLPFVYWMSFPMCEARIVRAREQAGLRARIVLAKGMIEHWLLYRLVLPAARHVFVQSDTMAEMVQGKGVPASKITAVPMGVDTELLAAPDTAPPVRGNAPQIAYLGTLDRLRRLDELIDALQLVRRRHPTATLLLIGGGEPADAASLVAHATKLGLQDAVKITGWLPSGDAWQLLRGADVAVSYIPRGLVYDVSSPTKILEYLALGMPNVGNDIPDQAWVLRNSDAGWLTRTTVEALAEALCEVLDDPEYARARAAKGPAFIENTRSYRVLAQQLAARYHGQLGAQG
ncbi:glycosyltransferase [Pseudoduganella sp. SL102]|uniref:glycosyltransferase n=1 Tax=Pseudoduganella sp. SL102 TaxID=2995154 RepID=UPI00248C7245|nr:glycosyltransferase [Pseudoduganella sp. SL102]WBS04466.1 glycosyltransferase [Pseudoduganella sp. SL102]